MARRLARFLVVGVATGLLLIVIASLPAHGADSKPVVAGNFTGKLKVTKSWVPGGYGVHAGTSSYSFGKGCVAGAPCTVKGSGGMSQSLTPRAGGFGYSESVPIGCIDDATGASRTVHGFDYTYKVHFTPSATATRDGVSYVTAMRGTYDAKLAVNATGRTFNCLVNPRRVPAETEHGVYTLSLVPLAAPRLTALTAPLGIDKDSATTTGTMPAFRLPQTDRQEASAQAVADGRRSSVPGALVTPSEAFSNIGDRLPRVLLLAALLGLLMIFPAQLFNSTYEENHQRIDRQLAKLKLRRPKPPVIPVQPGPASQPPPTAVDTVPARGRRLAVFAACVAAGTILGGLLDPKFGANTASYALVVGIFLAVVLSVLLTAFAGRLFRSVAHHGHSWYLRAIPSALLVAALCVLVSRVTHFAPGYLYGVLGGAVFATALDRRSEGRAEVTVSVAGLTLALAAWVVFEPVAKAADGADPAFWVLGADAFLAALFIGGIEGLLFGLIPLRFLPGHRIRGWNWIAWAALTTVVLVTFVHVLLLPESGYLGRSTTASVSLTLALFITFGVGSGLFWLWFRLRPDKEADEADEAATLDGTRPSRRVRVPANGPSGSEPQLPEQGRPGKQEQP